MTTLLCPYCNNPAELICSTKFYSSGKDYGLMYVCYPCDARIGIRKETAHLQNPEPSGLMANAELRAAKKKAHNAFDPLWQSKLISRSSAYKWLATEMQISPKDCHIGMFNIEQCNIVTSLSNVKYNLLKK